MKIWEIDFTEGKKFLDSEGMVWVVVDDGNFHLSLRKDGFNGNGIEITNNYHLRTILNYDFTEIIDWSKVEVDTPVWVRESNNDSWQPRHFHSFIDGMYACITNGYSIHTTQDKNVTFSWKYCSLTDHNKGE